MVERGREGCVDDRRERGEEKRKEIGRCRVEHMPVCTHTHRAHQT